jgi:outer membrane protein OmpA-like peptidoglycan-associated protein
MRHPIISTTLSLVLGSGLALADEGQMKSPPQPTAMDVFFDTDSSDLKADNEADLQALANWAKCKKTHIIKLEGHADPRGTVEHNAELSENRAEAVTEKLVELGAPRDRIVVTLYGELGESRGTLQQDRRVSATAEKQPEIVGSR